MKRKTERTARSRVFLGVKMLNSQQTQPVFGFCSCKLAEVHIPMICDNETLSVVDCNAISQNYWIYHRVSKGSQDPVEFWGTVCMISAEVLLIFAEPSTNFSEWIMAFSKWWHFYPIPIVAQLQSILARKALEDLSKFSWHRAASSFSDSSQSMQPSTGPKHIRSTSSMLSLCKHSSSAFVSF